jgi:hypothetical protein
MLSPLRKLKAPKVRFFGKWVFGAKKRPHLLSKPYCSGIPKWVQFGRKRKEGPNGTKALPELAFLIKKMSF